MILLGLWALCFIYLSYHVVAEDLIIYDNKDVNSEILLAFFVCWLITPLDVMMKLFNKK